MIIKKQLLAIALGAMALTACNEKEVFNYLTPPDIETHLAYMIYDEMPAQSKSFVLALDEPNSVVVSQRSFNTKKIVRAEATSHYDSIKITSYSAKPIQDINVWIYLEELGEDVKIATLDSIPMFGEVTFRPDFLDKHTSYALNDGRIITFKKEYLTDNMSLTIESDCEHFRMLKRIKTDWDLSFSNYDWNPEGNTSWLELRPMVAREWVVIMTNLGYMLSSPEYHEVMNNFATVFGGELYGNNGEHFSTDDYNAFIERCFQKKRFVLGRVNPAYVAGLGGGSTLGVADWNFYGHYASYSGWEAISHEVGHCFGFSHSSNFTYPSSEGIGWTSLITNLHVYMNTLGNMPYESRTILNTHSSEYDEYRGFKIDATKMNDAQTAKMYESSKVRKYFDNEL